MKNSIFIFLIVIIIFLAAGFSFIANAQSTKLLISPSTQEASSQTSTSITVYVYIEDVIDLYGYQYDVTYDSSVLSYSSLTEENFLKKDGQDTYCLTPDTSTAGQIKNIACTRQGTESSVDGSGKLSKIVFSVKSGVTPPKTVTISTNLRIVGLLHSNRYKIGRFDSNHRTFISKKA